MLDFVILDIEDLYLKSQNMVSIVYNMVGIVYNHEIFSTYSQQICNIYMTTWAPVADAS